MVEEEHFPTTYKLEGLDPESEYVFQIRVFTKNGECDDLDKGLSFGMKNEYFIYIVGILMFRVVFNPMIHLTLKRPN